MVDCSVIKCWGSEKNDSRQPRGPRWVLDLRFFLSHIRFEFIVYSWEINSGICVKEAEIWSNWIVNHTWDSIGGSLEDVCMVETNGAFLLYWWIVNWSYGIVRELNLFDLDIGYFVLFS